MSFLSQEEIQALGFKAIGANLKISRYARIYNPSSISLGSNVRIDDFAILSAGKGGIEIGDYVHIASYCGLMGAAAIRMENFSGLSSRVFLYSSSDDYSGESLTNPTLPDDFKKIISADVHLGKHVIIGTCATVLPGVKIGEGAAVGAYSLVTKNIDSWTIVAGTPCRFLKSRSKNLLKHEEELIKRISKE